ncbi:MAG: plasmid partitioning protein RepB [Verrucomicrobia bacterium]|nr:plasmid partitioning protein RepB [Verrucomicrobiota bacterium]
MNRKETLRALLNPQAAARPPESPAETPEPPGASSPEVSEPRRTTGSGAVRSMGLTLQKLSAEAENARALRVQLAQGASVVELDPELIEPSFISDRFSRDQDDLFLALVESIRTHGQQVPVLLRPYPDKPGRYQVAYGHRRIEAARRLGQKVRALIRDLSDVELVIAQGKENSERKDLSFIERAVFARHLEERGFDRSTIIAALSVDKAEAARLLSVAHSIPAQLVLAIGPAPKAGRPRWLALAQLLNAKPSTQIIEQYLNDPALKQMDSDGRFIRLFTLLSSRHRLERTPAVWKDAAGRPIVRIEPGARKTRLTIDEKLAPAFGAFIMAKLDDLYQAFGQQSGRSKSEPPGVSPD